MKFAWAARLRRAGGAAAVAQAAAPPQTSLPRQRASTACGALLSCAPLPQSPRPPGTPPHNPAPPRRPARPMIVGCRQAQYWPKNRWCLAAGTPMGACGSHLAEALLPSAASRHPHPPCCRPAPPTVLPSRPPWLQSMPRAGPALLASRARRWGRRRPAGRAARAGLALSRRQRRRQRGRAARCASSGIANRARVACCVSGRQQERESCELRDRAAAATCLRGGAVSRTFNYAVRCSPIVLGKAQCLQRAPGQAAGWEVAAHACEQLLEKVR